MDFYVQKGENMAFAHLAPSRSRTGSNGTVSTRTAPRTDSVRVRTGPGEYFQGSTFGCSGEHFFCRFFVFSREHRDVADVYVASLLNMRKIGAINNEKMGT